MANRDMLMDNVLRDAFITRAGRDLSYDLNTLPDIGEEDNPDGFKKFSRIVYSQVRDVCPVMTVIALLWYIKGKINRWEDLHRFHAAAMAWKVLYKRNKLTLNIQHYPDLVSLENDVEKFDVTHAVTSAETKALYASQEAFKAYEDDKWKAIFIGSARASQVFGRGSRWCISATKSKNYFDSYHQNNEICFLVDKEKNTKFALLWPRDRDSITTGGYFQAWNAQDAQVTNDFLTICPKLPNWGKLMKAIFPLYLQVELGREVEDFDEKEKTQWDNQIQHSLQGGLGLVNFLGDPKYLEMAYQNLCDSSLLQVKPEANMIHLLKSGSRKTVKWMTMRILTGNPIVKYVYMPFLNFDFLSGMHDEKRITYVTKVIDSLFKDEQYSSDLLTLAYGLDASTLVEESKIREDIFKSVVCYINTHMLAKQLIESYSVSQIVRVCNIAPSVLLLNICQHKKRISVIKEIVLNSSNSEALWSLACMTLKTPVLYRCWALKALCKTNYEKYKQFVDAYYYNGSEVWMKLPYLMRYTIIKKIFDPKSGAYVWPQVERDERLLSDDEYSPSRHRGLRGGVNIYLDSCFLERREVYPSVVETIYGGRNYSLYDYQQDLVGEFKGYAGIQYSTFFMNFIARNTHKGKTVSFTYKLHNQNTTTAHVAMMTKKSFMLMVEQVKKNGDSLTFGSNRKNGVNFGKIRHWGQNPTSFKGRNAQNLKRIKNK